ncbi:MAG: 5'-3' exonuclease H3TH domain-containing protein, partial [Gammaproteobacteria bacterium]
MNTQAKKIFLIDGSSYLYRAFHAMPPLSTSNGLPTGAVKGVVNMLRNLRKENPNSHYLSIFDAKGKNFRHDIYREYKANRPPMPEDLREQLSPLKEICNAMGMPVIEIPNVEADDVIASLATLGSKQSIPIVISSLDKDLMQLVDDPLIKMMNTMNNQIYDVSGVKEKFGVHPNQIIDYLAIVGDSSDNIPGVPKVGPKTAVKWLKEFKNLRGIIKNADSLSGVVGQNFRDSIPYLDRNIELVTLKRDVDIGVSLESLLKAKEDQEELNKLFTSLEFKTWIKSSFDSSDEKPKNANRKKEYQSVLKEKELIAWAKKIEKCKVFAIDTETSSLDTMTADLIGISLACDEGEGCYIPINHSYEGMPSQLSIDLIQKTLGSVISKNQKKLVGQNLKFDLPMLNRHGIDITDFLGDTMLMSYVLNSTGTRHGLDRMAQHYLNYEPMKYEEVVGSASKQINFAQVEISIATFYAAEDADITLRLFNHLSKMLADQPKLLNLLKDIEYPMLNSLIRVERNGAKIDAKMLSEYSDVLSIKIEELSKTAYE